MNKIFYVLSLCWCCAYLLPQKAFSADSCSAQFSYTFSGNHVSFHSVPGLPAGTAHWWVFGDSAPGNGDANPTHVYPGPGTYFVKHFTVNQDRNCKDSVFKEIHISQECNVNSEFEAVHDPAQLNKIWFKNQSEPVSNIWRTSWSYGDGTYSHDFNSFHVYSHTGKYNVCLEVQSLQGCTSKDCDTVIVGRRNEINCDTVHLKFEYTRNSEIPNKITFHAISNVPIIRQRWIIARATTTFPPPAPVIIESINPTYTFKDTGWYYVCLYAVTAGECQKVYCEKLHIERVVHSAINGYPVPVYPNPANSMIRLELQMEKAAKVHIRVLDATGVAKIELNTSVSAGNNYITIPVDKLSSGLYLVEIRYDDQIKLAKFQKS